MLVFVGHGLAVGSHCQEWALEDDSALLSGLGLFETVYDGAFRVLSVLYSI